MRTAEGHEAWLVTDYTQVRRLSSMLDAAIGATREKVNDTDDVLVAWIELERQILRIHEIWDYFRSKLALSPAL